jgi:hypothetical protein
MLTKIKTLHGLKGYSPNQKNFYPPLSRRPHNACIALAGTRVMNRMSVEGDGVRAGGVTVTLLGDEPLSPGLCGGWRRECRSD